MPDLWMDVDAAIAEAPVNIMSLIDDTDFKTREQGIVFNESGMDLVWNFVTTAGAQSLTAVVPTAAGDYDWAIQGDGMYSIEIPAAGGISINNDTEGFGWFTGICDGVLPWRGPIIGFRAAALNNALIDGGDILDVNVTEISDDAGAATNAEAFFDGTGYAGTNNVIPTVTVVTGIGAGGIDAASFAVGAIDAAAIAPDAIGASEIAADAIGSSELAASAVLEIADGIWDEARAGHVAGGSFGEGVASVQGNVTGNLLGTIGGLIAAALADFFDTDSGTTYGAAVAGSVVQEIADNAATGPAAAVIADAVLDEVYEGAETFREYLRGSRSALYGLLSRAGNVLRFRNEADTRDRLVVTTNVAEERTIIVEDLAP